ncbi:MAG: C25 family cysteine peptidase, partial [Cyclobacteriaceae bacterium]|nr:C25 family cysteine peptidase [Cyclobacteriaceae bacterium]
MRIGKLLLCSGLILACIQKGQAQNSVLAEGRWLKIAISKPGVYSITYAQLRNAGINPDNINPSKIKVYGNPGGMLPQANNIPRPTDLVEKNILVTGQADGVFNSGDQVIFYADGPDRVFYETATDFLSYEQNLYARQNFCFLTVDGQAGKRISIANNVTATTNYTNYTDVYHYESSLYNLVRSGRTWLGERLTSGTNISLSIPWSGISTTASAKIKMGVANAATGQATFTTTINGTESLVQNVIGITGTRYGFKFISATNTKQSTGAGLGFTNATNQQLTVSYTQAGGSGSGYLDFVTINAERLLTVYGKQTIFNVPATRLQSAASYVFSSPPQEITVWDVTEPGQEKIHVLQNNSFSAITDGKIKSYIAFTTTETPESLAAVANQNIRGSAVPALAIVCPPDFFAEAQRLAAHRTNVSQLPTQVYLQDQIFNEFSGGKPDVSAIRDFARHLHKTSPTNFRYFLLFCKGSFDYLNVLKKNNNKILTYESRNSFAPLETYSSDDYF